MDQKHFLAEYHVKGVENAFGNEIYASSMDEANRIAKQRGLGEIVISAGSDKEPEASLADRLADAGIGMITIDDLHRLVFLASIAVASSVRDGYDLLNDAGVVHRAVHWLADVPDSPSIDPTPKDSWDRFVADVRALEDDVPGYKPSVVK